jgi:cytochrome c biogenesis protein CcmG/thiol:disulfide interchange protein DsbE
VRPQPAPATTHICVDDHQPRRPCGGAPTLRPVAVRTEEPEPSGADGPSRSLGVLRGLAIGAAIALLALLTYGVVTQPADTTIDEAIAQGEPVAAPGFELEVLTAPEDGQGAAVQAFARAASDGRVGLQELRGTPVVLNFWASWCEPCREEAPVLQSAWERSAGDGVLVLGLNMQDARPDARAFVEEFGLAYPNVREPGGDVARSYGMTGLPETFFISAQGDVVAHARGAVDASQLERGVAAAIAGEPAALR